MSVADTLKTKVETLFKDLTKMHDIDRDVLKDFVKAEIDGHKNFTKALKSMTKVDMDKFQERISVILPSAKVKAVSSWMEYKKSLQTRASQVEHAKMFDSIVRTREAMISILEDISKKFNQIFDSEMISVTNLKKSQIATLGFIAHSIILSNWSLYMWTLLSSLVDGSETEIPKYRLDFISKYTKETVDIVNGIMSNEKASVADGVLKLRSKGADTPLAVNGVSNINITIIDPAYISIAATVGYIVLAGISMALIIMIGLKLVSSLFRMGREHLETAAYESYLKNKEMKEWLEAHVAKLRMELQSVNPNDPQYQKMLKIIDVYDEKIRDLDEKINEYMEI